MTYAPLTFAVAASALRERADVGFADATIKVKERYANSRFPLVRLGDLTLGIQYGTSQRATVAQEDGDVPVLRMSNLRGDEIDLRELKYLKPSSAELLRYQLDDGDLLFNRTNSKELVGKCAVWQRSYHPEPIIFASYLLRVRVDEERVLPEFVSYFLATPAGRMQIDRFSRQIIGMANINTEEIRKIEIPLPPLDLQRQMVDRSSQVLRSTSAMRLRAKTTIENIGINLERRLDAVASNPREAKTSFAIPLDQLKGKRLDPASFQMVQSLSSSTETVRIADIAEVNPKSRPIPGKEGRSYPFVGLPECDQTSVREISYRPYEDVRGKPYASVGDVLFARIEPSIYNRKYVFVEPEFLGSTSSFWTSTEFYVIRVDGTKASAAFVWASLFTPLVQAQIEGKTTGSSGRRRLDADAFRNILIAYPDLLVQEQIASDIQEARREAAHLEESAISEWETAKHVLETQLLGE